MSKTVRLLVRVAFAVLLLAVSAGCDRRTDGRSHVRVSGKVTCAGKPVKTGRITFTPVGGGQAYEDTIYSGQYGIHSRTPMPPGDYTVTVAWSSTGSSLGGYDLQRSQKVTLGAFARYGYDFELK